MLRLSFARVRGWVAATLVIGLSIAWLSARPAAAAGLPLPMLSTVDKAVPASVDPAAPKQSSVLDAFGKTRLFQLAEGKRTTNLDEMMHLGFWVDTIKELVIAAVSFVPRLLVSVLFLVVFWGIYRAVRRMMLGAMTRAHLDPSIRDMLITLTKWTIMGFGLVIACNQIGIPIVAMLTGVSILGLAVGFAAQETLANFIAGIVIFWDKPFKVGDWLTVEGTYGQVQRITFRSCRLLTTDGEIAIFPNTFMLAHRVANHTAHPQSRINISLMVSVKTDIVAAKRVLLATTAGDARLLKHPAPEVVVADCVEATNTLMLRFWIANAAHEHEMAFAYREKARLALDKLASATGVASAAPALAA